MSLEQPDSNQTPGDSFESLRSLVSSLGRLVRTRLWLQIVIGLLLGIGLGLLLSPKGAALISEGAAHELSVWLALPGHIFLALIQMMVVPLVMASIVLGITGTGDVRQLRQVGMRILPYFIATTLVAVLIGSFVATAIEPGRFIDPSFVEAALAEAHNSAAGEFAAPAPSDMSLPERIVDLIPTNPLDAALEQSMLQIIVFAILIGIALALIAGPQARPLIDLAGSVQEVSMKVVSWAMLIAPLAVFGLLAQITIKVGLNALVSMSAYVGSVLLGLLLLLVFYLLIVALWARRSPLRFLAQVRNVQLLAFSTSSSAAVMPVSLKVAEDTLGVDPAVARFVVPIGATINMDGTALYQIVAAIFLTQVFGIDLTMGGLILLIATTVGASIGSPSTPGVGIVILATVLAGIGVPGAGIALILGVDRILDMARTAVNVTGDLTACVVMDKSLKTLD